MENSSCVLFVVSAGNDDGALFRSPKGTEETVNQKPISLVDWRELDLRLALWFTRF